MNQNKARVAILISNNVDFGARNIIKDKERHVTMIKVLFHRDDIIILNIYICLIIKPQNTQSQNLQN